MTHSCPECGYEVQEVPPITSAGGHADQSWHKCPNCGEEPSFMGWAVLNASQDVRYYAQMDWSETDG